MRYEARVDPDRPGFWLLDIRRNMGLGQKELHAKGFESQVSLWERGHREPSLASLLKIAEAQGMELWVSFRERSEG